MLVLSRKRGEPIVIRCADGSYIRMTVVEIKSDRVRVGFQAHKDIAIHREELLSDAERGVVDQSFR